MTQTAPHDQGLQRSPGSLGSPPTIGASDRTHPFQEWLQAIADLGRAEARGADDAERRRLSAEVDRARGAAALSVAQ
jgi:hypothetical protein